MRSVAKLLQEARASADLTQLQLAERAGLSQSAVARYERGVTLPTLPTIERLVAACGRSLELRTVVRAGQGAAPSTVRGRLGPNATLLRQRRRVLLAAAAARGVSRIRVFGSTARGEETPDSDIDLLVDLDPDRTLVDLIGFGREASELLGVQVDVATADMLEGAVRDEAERAALPL